MIIFFLPNIVLNYTYSKLFLFATKLSFKNISHSDYGGGEKPWVDILQI